MSGRRVQILGGGVGPHSGDEDQRGLLTVLESPLEVLLTLSPSVLVHPSAPVLLLDPPDISLAPTPSGSRSAVMTASLWPMLPWPLDVDSPGQYDFHSYFAHSTEK